MRADSYTERPEGLGTLEAKAYTRGYARSCLAYHRKHGNPSIAEAEQNTWDRHPTAHRGGLAALAKERILAAQYEALRDLRLVREMELAA